MNPITIFLTVACLAVGAGLGAIGHLYAGVPVVIVAIIIAAALKMANTWEKFVILRAGKLRGVKGPGLFIIIPVIDRVVAVIDERIQTTAFSADDERRSAPPAGESSARTRCPIRALHPLRMALEKFWAPVPWMLEAAIVLELALGKYVEAAIIAVLLVFNARSAVPGEPRPGDPCRAEVAARAERIRPARRRVEDRARGRTGAGRCGEAFARRRGRRGCAPHRGRSPARPIHAHRRIRAHRSRRRRADLCGALVRRGEAVAEVTATGARTKFGRTAELVRTAHVVSSQQKAVLRVVRNLAAFNGVVIVMLVAYAWFLKMPLAEIIPLVLTAVLASIPVALPATFTLASALGARAWQSWAFFRPASPRWMKRRRWMSCAPTRPAR
jgi:hypothetical protein